MLTKTALGLVALVGVIGTGLTFGGTGKAPQAAKAGCCFPGAECCEAKLPCCDTGDCCENAAACCEAGEACCAEGAVEAGCCAEGAECCFPGSPCCGGARLTLCRADVPSTRAAGDGRPATTKTTVVVDGLHCPNCAKKVVKVVTGVSGVGEAKADVEKQTVTVGPKAGESPSPKAIWEAVEKAGYKPTKLEGPDGTFETKPAK